METPVRRIELAGLDAEAREEVLAREWLVTNGLGGYASGTIGGVATRRYHGLLVAALPAPLGRVMLLDQVAESFRHPDGSPLREGDQLTVRIAADDFDDVTVGKLPGYSSEIEIRIVSRTAFDIAMNKEQAKLQQDLGIAFDGEKCPAAGEPDDQPRDLHEERRVFVPRTLAFQHAHHARRRRTFPPGFKRREDLLVIGR